MKLGLGLGINSGGGASYAAEAKAFITAAGITDPTQKTAVDYLVKQLKANNLYSKFSVLYPFVGGSADTHKFNLINPVDSDAAFRIAWSGSVTHNANGIKSNGTNGYGDTKYNPVAASASLTSFSLGAYKTGIEANGISRAFMGNALNSNPDDVTTLAWFNAGSKAMGTIAGLNTQYVPSEANTQAEGMLSITTNGNRSARYYRIGNLIGSPVTQSGNFHNSTFYLLAINRAGTAANYALDVIIKLAYVSTGLSDAEMATLHTIITAYQTLLGRD